MIELRGRLSDPHDADANRPESAPSEDAARDEQHAPEHPLSYGQRALWFLHRLAPESAAYNVFFAMRVLSELNAPALRRAFQTLIDRHPSLRTTYVVRDGNAAQVVHAHREVHFEEVDAASWSEEELDARLLEEAHRPFDLETGPLFRVNLFARGHAPAVLLLTAHHIAIDLWSLVLVMNDLRLMRGGEGGGPAALPPPPELRYTDYARWQAEMLAGERGERLWEYWHKQLAGELPALNLPLDRPRPPVQTYRGASHAFKLDARLTARLGELAKAERATLYMTLLAAFQTLLYRYTSQEEILIGSLASGRSRAQFKTLVGYFVNPLVMRADLSGNPTFREFLGRVRQTVLAALKRQDYPFPLLIERLQPARDTSRSPLFQAMFLLQRLHRLDDHNVPVFVMGEAGARMEIAGHEVESHALQERVAQFELELIMVEADETLSGVLRYNTDLFDASTAARMVEHLRTLIESVLDNPDGRLADLPLLAADERRRLLVEWNDTQTAYAEDVCVQRLFEEQAARRPGAVAVAFEDEELTYGELNRRAGGLARRLRRLGVGPDTVVAVYAERSPRMLAGVLGVLKAGGAYLPLDTASPRDRLAFMLEDARPHVLLTEEHLLDELPDTRPPVILLDADPEDAAHADAKNLEGAADNLDGGPVADHLAYVIYTSGSTGRPKGVMVAHRSLNNFVAAMDERLGDEPPGAWLAVTNLSFDISVLELLWTLARGFKVVVHAGQEFDPAAHAPDDAASAGRKIDFSLFYFASDDGDGGADKYRLLVEGAKFADRHGFAAVWTPERHFHGFGGLYPNPSVTSAALSTVTERVGLRAGSVVLPLHNPLRVAEEWSVVDNLSKGRTAIAFASGWHADDFVFAPDSFEARKEVMASGIESVRRLWRGESISVRGGAGRDVEVRIFPRPVQPELPVWITAAGSAETFRMAGEIGANVLTHLLGQSFEEVAEKIAVYREARARHGHGADGGCVTLMLHTFVGRDHETVREKVFGPFCNYLRSSFGLWRGLARSMGQDVDSADFTEDDTRRLLERAFDRYFETSGLFGTPAACLRMVERLKAIGVDEVACLIDFGIDADSVMSSLRHLNLVRQRSERRAGGRDHSLPALVERHHVTHLQCTPSMAKMLLLDPRTKSALGRLRVLMLGGETFPAPLAAELGAVFGGKLLNMYGPTETTIWSATHEVDGAHAGSIPIGRPVSNTEIYILDARLRPVPEGVPGELYIGGRGLARGYLNRPDLTAERFVPDPFSPRAGARLYRTGDLARFLSGGVLEFLGRADTQVKVRGHRIEPGEIEAALAGHDAVREAVVAARADGAGEVRLVAYVVTTGPVATGELRHFLRQKLPDYMIPSAFVALDSMPLMPSGKIDRRRLPAPAEARAEGAPDYVAPQTDLERTIAGIWREVLGVERVGAGDNFFDLGGHSLGMAQVHAKLREVLETDVAVVELFKYPTVSALAQYFTRRQGRPARSLSEARPSPSQQTDDRVRKRKEVINRRRQLTRGA
jgi:natural product biosynthesis luciferase-like monooxygenase protein